MGHLQGKRVLVTGSRRGIGFGVARAFAAEGARVGIHGSRLAADADALCAQLQEAGAAEARFFVADLRDPAAIHAMMDEVEAWGGVDILVNNAGRQFTAPIPEMPDETWADIIAVNLSSAFYTMKRAMPGMEARGYGRVINIASVHGLVASVEKTPYVSAKFGMVGLGKVVALEYAAKGDPAKGGITVNTICPGWVETELIEPQIQARITDGTRESGIRALLAEKQPSGRLSTPEEIGALAVWLSSPVAHNLTGAAIPVDGGWTAQ